MTSMKAKLTEIAEEFDRHAVDVSRKNGKFVVTPEETGRIMDQEKQKPMRQLFWIPVWSGHCQS